MRPVYWIPACWPYRARPRDWDESFDIIRALQGSDACGTNSLADLAQAFSHTP